MSTPTQPVTDEQIDAEGIKCFQRGYQREWREFARAVLALAPQQAGGEAESIRIDFRQATDLLAMFGGEPAEITLALWGDEGHDGPGLYAWYTDFPEEGSVNLGITDEEATLDDAAPAAAEPSDDAKAAERYRWLKARLTRTVWCGSGYEFEIYIPDPERTDDIDATIDAAQGEE